MTATLSDKGEIVLPTKLRRQKRLKPGDGFEVVSDPDDPDAIILRKIQGRPNQGLVEHLLACPVKGFPIPARCKGPARKFKR